MRCLIQQLTKDTADALNAHLREHGVSGVIRKTEGNEPDDNARYAIFVAENDYEDAGTLVDVSPENETEEDYLERIERTHVSIVVCPRCGARKATYPDAVNKWVALILLGIPYLLEMIKQRTRGSLKRCTSCMHEWRSIP